MDLKISGKRALVLGGSRGIGSAIACSLAKEGVNVTAASRSAAFPKGVPEDRKHLIHPVKLDLNDFNTAIHVLESLVKNDSFDILINNTGGPPPGSVTEIKYTDWILYYTSMAANLFAITNMLIPGMKSKGWGRIITSTSSGVVQPIPNLAISNTTRAAIVAWSKSLANEVACFGITVNVIIPGRIHTERIDELNSKSAARSGKTAAEVSRDSLATIPMGRYGDPDEYANVVTFLSSECASYVTGTCLRVDGGLIKSL